MIQQIAVAVILASAIVFLIFWFIDCLVGENECKHEQKTTYDSYHKQVCIDCGKEFLNEEEK